MSDLERDQPLEGSWSHGEHDHSPAMNRPRMPAIGSATPTSGLGFLYC